MAKPQAPPVRSSDAADEVVSSRREMKARPKPTRSDQAQPLLPHQVLLNFKAELFQGLAHPTRLAIVEALHDGELSAGELIRLLELERVNASQHLAVLRSKNIVVGRKEGNHVFYSLRDSRLNDILGTIRGYLKFQLETAQARLKELGHLN